MIDPSSPSLPPDRKHLPLDGLRILDATRILAGPTCGQLLADLGADVVKLERPQQGDDTRTWGPPFAEHGPSAYYLACNRGKRGLALDLSTAEGRAVFHNLCRRADIVLENFLPETAARLGLDAATLFAVNPRLIVCSITGFGHTGPLRETPGYDFAIQALSGLMSITGPVEGPPYKVGVAVTDVITGLYAAISILACLHHRHITGHGYAIDLSLLDCAVAAQVNVVQAYLSTGRVVRRQGNAHLQIVPYQLFETADGWIVVAVGNDVQWQRFCSVVSPELGQQQRYATNPQRVQLREELIPQIQTLLCGRSTAEWSNVLEEVRVPCAAVLDHAQLFAHPQAEARGLRVTVYTPEGKPVDLVGSPFHLQTLEGKRFQAVSPLAPPGLGEHTNAVLRDWLGEE